MPNKKIQQFLDRNDVEYRVIPHAPAYTMPEVAHTAHISGKQVAKTVMVELDGETAMVVVPSSSRVDLSHLREITGAKHIHLETEEQFEQLFPGCETGAMPAFGNLYGLPVYVAPELSEHERIAFNAGTHDELIEMRFRDFQRLVRPRIPAETFATP